MKTKPFLPSAFSLAVFIFSYGFLLYRIHFGVDFLDEPFYTALCLRLFTGQALLRDELNLASGFSLFSYPFFWVFSSFSNSLEGIILYMRYVFFVSYLIFGGALFLLTKKSFGWALALTISASAIVFIPFNILSLSYNTLGTFFLTLSLFLLWRGASDERLFSLVGSGIFIDSAGWLMCHFSELGSSFYFFHFFLKKVGETYYV